MISTVKTDLKGKSKVLIELFRALHSNQNCFSRCDASTTCKAIIQGNLKSANVQVNER